MHYESAAQIRGATQGKRQGGAHRGLWVQPGQLQQEALSLVSTACSSQTGAAQVGRVTGSLKWQKA